MAQLAARYVRDVEAGGSNPLTPTIFRNEPFGERVNLIGQANLVMSLTALKRMVLAVNRLLRCAALAMTAGQFFSANLASSASLR